MENKLKEGLNRQINKELYSAYLYFGMSSYFEEINMTGISKIIKKQAKEELSHVTRIYNYLVARDVKTEFYQVEAPECNWINPIDAIKSALHHEKTITNAINELYKLSKETEDFASEVFLQWFIKEQVEEEEKFRCILAKMENIRNFDCEIINIDRWLDS